MKRGEIKFKYRHRVTELGRVVVYIDGENTSQCYVFEDIDLESALYKAKAAMIQGMRTGYAPVIETEQGDLVDGC